VPNVPTRLEAALSRIDALERRVGQLEGENELLRAQSRAQYRENLELKKENTDLRAELDVAGRRMCELESKLLLAHKDSATSSKPPSTDDTHHPRRYPARQKSTRPSGGQVGHAGAGREWNPAPDQVIDHRPPACKSCGGDLSAIASKVAERRQVINVVVTTTTTEHRVHAAVCSCGVRTQAAFPKEATGSICFGPSVKAGVLALSSVGKLPSRVTTDLASSVFGIEISAGVLDTWRKELASGLFAWDTRVVELLGKAPVLGADESQQ